MILARIAEKPRHGNELIKAIGEGAGGAYAPSPDAAELNSVWGSGSHKGF